MANEKNNKPAKKPAPPKRKPAPKKLGKKALVDGEILPPDLQDQLEKAPERERTQIIATYYKRTVSGPFPPPDYLKGYVEVYPPAAKEIFREFRINGAHRRKQEKEDQAFNHLSFQQAQYFSLGIIVLLIGGAIFALYLSYPWIAGIMLGVPLLNQIYKMIYGAFRRKEPDSKDSD